MYTVKVVNKQNLEDVAIDRKYEDKDSALKYYNSVKSMGTTLPNGIFRDSNEEKGIVELKYTDIIVTVEDEEGKVIVKFMIG